MEVSLKNCACRGSCVPCVDKLHLLVAQYALITLSFRYLSLIEAMQNYIFMFVQQKKKHLKCAYVPLLMMVSTFMSFSSFSLRHTFTKSLGTKGHGLYLLVFTVLIGACCLCHGPALNNGLSKDPIQLKAHGRPVLRLNTE